MSLAGFLRKDGSTTPTGMLNWTIIFLILALIVGILGFSSLAGAAAGIAQILFLVFVVLLIVSGINRILHGENP